MAEIYQVLWSLAVHAAEHHDAQLVGDSLRYISQCSSVCRSRNKPRSNLVVRLTTLIVCN